MSLRIGILYEDALANYHVVQTALWGQPVGSVFVAELAALIPSPFESEG